MDSKDYLAYKAKGNVTLERMTKEVDEDGEKVIVPDEDAVKVTPQRFDPITGAKAAAQPVIYSISGLQTDRANHVAEIERIDELLADLEGV